MSGRLHSFHLPALKNISERPLIKVCETNLGHISTDWKSSWLCPPTMSERVRCQEDRRESGHAVDTPTWLVSRVSSSSLFLHLDFSLKIKKMDYC